MIFLQLHWNATITKNKAALVAFCHDFPQLKHLEIGGFRCRDSACQIILYMVGNAAGRLESVVIDTSIHSYDARHITTEEEIKKIRGDNRNGAITKLKGAIPQWIKLRIL